MAWQQSAVGGGLVLGGLVFALAGRADETMAAKAIEKLGGKVLVYDKQPGKPTAEEVRDYLKKMAISHKQLYKGGNEFGMALAPALAGKTEDLLVLNKKYRELVKVLAHVLKESKSREAPDHPAVKTLAGANDRFMEFQIDLVANMIPELIDVAEDVTLDLEAKRQRMREITSKISQQEKSIGRPLLEATTEVRRIFKLEADK